MEEIKKILQDIEIKKSIKILYACETGSRAWGFPSPDSDYDVRFIYMHDRNWYLSLNEKKDMIEYMEGDLDITGWDLKKSLLLLKKSNAPLIERFQSPVEYYDTAGFREEFSQLISHYYSPTALFYHHYRLATNFWEELKDARDIKLKSFFYLIRSLLSCEWIIKDKTVLPMHIEGLMKYTAEDWCEQLRQLIELKAGKSETYLHPIDKNLKERIADSWALIDASKENLGTNNSDLTAANQYFLKMLNCDDDN